MIVTQRTMAEFLTPVGFSQPAAAAVLRESSIVREVGRYALHAASASGLRHRTPYASRPAVRVGDPVLLVPGFLAGDGTLALMSKALRRQGFRTYRSDMRANVGCTLAAAAQLEERLEEIAQRRGSRVQIVGHSLGGMLARGLAARRPDLIEGIVSMGSPVLAPGAIHKVLAWDAQLLSRLTSAGFGGMMSADCFGGECARLSWEESQIALDPDVAFTAIYSKRDGIVDWRACLDPAAQHVEVRTSHCGMAVDPVVMDHVLAALRDQQLRRASLAAAPVDEVDSLRVVHT
jgi:triacylglycerol lipase